MAEAEPIILLFALLTAAPPADSLESRVKRLLEAEPSTVSLDGPAFDAINGSGAKADYLLAQRRFITELKTLNGDPLGRVEQRLQTRFAEAGAPLVFGHMGMNRVLDAMPDRDELLKATHDLSGRRVRANLATASGQIDATRKRLSLPNAAGLAILMNDTQEMIDAANIGYSFIAAFREHPERYANVDYIWASVESVHIRAPEGRTGAPQLLISRRRQPPTNEMDFLLRMLVGWARLNGGELVQIDHGANWEAFQPVYRGATPSMRLFS